MTGFKTCFVMALLAFGCSQGTNEMTPQNRTAENAKGIEHGQVKSVHKSDHPQADLEKPDVALSKTKAAAAGSDVSGKSAAFGPLKMDVPESWSKETPSSSMRLAQYKASDAELIVFYFGPNGAGSTEANIDRWASQFKDLKTGSPPKAQTKEVTLGKLKATKTYIAGSFASSMAPMAPAQKSAVGQESKQSDWAMRGAIVQSSNGPYYFKLIGPKQSIDKQEDAFESFLQSATE